MLSKFVEFSFALLLIAGVPVLSLLTARRSRIQWVPRSRIYFSAAISQWLLAGIGIVVLFVTSLTWSGVGFRPLARSTFTRWTAELTVVSLAVLGLLIFLEHRGWWPRASELIYRLLPETPNEKILAVLLLAPTAAFCEEFLYRGYLLTQLSRWSHSAIWGLGGSSAAFGLAHSYQGSGGVARAAFLGALLAYPVIRAGSLYPSMVTHFLVDVVALVWLVPKLLPRNSHGEGDLPPC